MKASSHHVKIISVFLLLVSCTTANGNLPNDSISNSRVVFQDEVITVEKKWDETSNTYYYLSRVKHLDQNGDLLKLKLDTSIFDLGEAVVDFANRKGNPMIVVNASTGLLVEDNRRRISPGITIIERQIIRQRIPTSYTLGIKQNNELVAYLPRTSPQLMIEDGLINGFSVFTPLIQNSIPVADNVISLIKNQTVVHPRQVIAQYENGDLLFFSCGGRGYDGAGMTAKDVIRILLEQKDKVIFAHNLDGGGSVTTVIYGDQITKKIDGKGTLNRLRPTFLYVELNNKK